MTTRSQMLVRALPRAKQRHRTEHQPMALLAVVPPAVTICAHGGLPRLARRAQSVILTSAPPSSGAARMNRARGAPGTGAHTHPVATSSSFHISSRAFLRRSPAWPLRQLEGLIGGGAGS